MAGCNKKIEQWVPRGYSGKMVPAKCGQTGIYGYPIFCDSCVSKYEDRDWRQEALENGEAWDEEDY
jgi:hypothetical protein